MWMFKKKKKTVLLFGKNIEPDCRYCSYNSGDEESICVRGHKAEASKCRDYEYNPLLREPKRRPMLNKNYSDEDFEL